MERVILGLVIAWIGGAGGFPSAANEFVPDEIRQDTDGQLPCLGPDADKTFYCQNTMFSP